MTAAEMDSKAVLVLFVCLVVEKAAAPGTKNVDFEFTKMAMALGAGWRTIFTQTSVHFCTHAPTCLEE